MNPPADLPHGIRGLAPYDAPAVSWWQLFAALLAMAVLVTFVLWLKKRFPRKQKPVAKDPIRHLMDQLRHLEPTAPFDAKAQQEFYYAASWHLRELIEVCSSIPASGLTLRELRQPLQHRLPALQERFSEVLSFLERAELVKFAGVPAELSKAQMDYRQLLEWSEQLVEATRREERARQQAGATSAPPPQVAP